MKISQAVRDARRAYTASAGGTARFLLTEICLRLICLAPALLLAEGLPALGIGLTLLLWIFLMLPARMNAARVMRGALRGGDLGSRGLADLSDYGAKLLCGLKRVFFLLLWALPLAALLWLAWTHYSGDLDSFTVLRMIKKELGGGDQMRGILVLVLMLAGSLLILLFGFAFHRGARHAFARGDMGIIRGRHGKILLAWLTGLTAVLPLLAALIIVIFRYLPAGSDLNGLLMKTVHLPSPRGTLIILLAGALLTVPLLPLRSLIPAAFVNGLEEKQ